MMAMVSTLILLANIASGFNYSNSGSDWNGLCKTGKGQSPISLSTLDSKLSDSTSTSVSVDFHTFQGHFITDKGLSVKIGSDYGTVRINSVLYTMIGIHYHSPSEHFIDGKQYDLEVHLVGTRAPGKFQVIAVLFEVGNQTNEFIQNTIDKFNQTENATFEMTWMICNGELENYFHYVGSLTAPIHKNDCTENVTWTVLKDPMGITQAQLDFFSNKWSNNKTFADGNGNNRILQDLNNRTVYYHRATSLSKKVCKAKTCPKIQCQATSNQNCYSVDSEVHSLYTCSSGTQCPDVSIHTAGPQTCSSIPSNDSSIITNDSDEVDKVDDKNVSYSSRVSGSSIDECPRLYDCISDLFCNEGNCVCRRKKSRSCESIYACVYGFVCNFGTCISYFSIDDGMSAETNLACKSAIIFNGTCQPAQKTVGALPKVCSSDEDCLASDGVTAGTCSCVFDELGQSYCKLHRSDPDVLNLLVYSHEGKNNLTRFYTNLVNLYPVHLFAEKCFVDGNKEIKELRQANDTKSFEGAAVIGLIAAWIFI